MNILIKNGTLLLEKNNIFYTEKSDLAIQDDIILSLGNISDDFKADKVIDASDMLVMPGLINSHTHAYMSLFRNVADDVPFDKWLFETVMPLEDKLTNEMSYWGNMLAFEEMIKSGTTTFVDMHMFRGMSCKAAVETGIRGVITRGLSGEGDNEHGRVRVEQALSEMQEYGDKPNLTFMMGPHAIYSCDTGFLEIVMKVAKEHGIGLNIHVSETHFEVNTCLEQHGKSPVEYLRDIGFFEFNTIAAHCVHLSDNDISILAENNVNVAHNPKSNMKLGNGFAPVEKMQNAGINLILGTDGASSNNTLNMFSEMNFTSLIHKGTAESATSISANDTLLMATKNAAKALKLNTGEIKEGKLADIILLDMNRPQLQPVNNIVSSLCYSANGSEVDTVIIGGKVVLEHGQLINIDSREIYRKAQESIDSIR